MNYVLQTIGNLPNLSYAKMKDQATFESKLIYNLLTIVEREFINLYPLLSELCPWNWNVVFVLVSIRVYLGYLYKR